MESRLLDLRARTVATLETHRWLPLLLLRITMAAVFVPSGWGKLHNLDGVTNYFTSLHIPMPHFNAILAASTEFVGGLLILLGLFTRLISIPLIVTMIVALITAKLHGDDYAQASGAYEKLTTFLAFDEWVYIPIFLTLIFVGPGVASLDALIAKKLEEQRGRAQRT